MVINTKKLVSSSIRNSLVDTSRNLPFGAFYIPFMDAGQETLFNLLSIAQINILTDEAHQKLSLKLLEKLVFLGAETLLSEFEKFRSNSTIENIEDQGSTIHNKFVVGLLDNDIYLMQNYPTLEKLILTTVDLWVVHAAEFINRLCADLSALKETFGHGVELGQVKSIEPYLPNKFDGVRSALTLTFSFGTQVIYNPVNMNLDKVFNELLTWCNHQGISRSFQPAKILAGEGYGWRELVAQKDCVDRSAVQHFYQRAGMLSALLFILGAKECDQDNLIAAGEYPYLVNIDTLISPEISDMTEDDRWFHDSVLKTGILPRWNSDMYTANALDSSPLGNIFPKQTNTIKEWEFVNTDQMRLVSKITVIPAGQNAVVLEGKTVSPQDYLEEIISGFQEVYQLFSRQQDLLLGATSPLAAFQHCRSRFQLRSNKTYGVICQQALKPQFLQGETGLIDNLLRHHAPSNVPINQHPQLQGILQAEIRSLQQQTIPIFSVGCDSTDLVFDGELLIEGFFAKSAYQRLIDRVKSLGAEQMAVQVEVIRSSFIAKFTHLKKNEAILQGDFPVTESLSPADLQEEADNIGNELVSSAIWDGDSCNWLALEYMFTANRYQLDVLDDSLFTGRAGVGVFLAALGKLSGNLRFKKVALGALEPFRRSIRSQKARPELLRSEFGLLGLGGNVYSMVKVSQFLQDSALLEDAVQAAKLLTPELIAADQKLDVIFGVAGALLGLLSLYEATQDASVLETAVLCGEHLLANRSDVAPRAWMTIKNESTQPLTGFSHGAAGFSLALLRLYAAAGNTEFLAAAEEGIEYERSVFNETVQNWPDFRLLEQKGEVSYMDAWCHGSTGIGLARLASWSILPSAEVRQDIEFALSTSQKNGTFAQGVDYLCCGSVGRIELLVVASELLADRQLLQAAQAGAAKMVTTARSNGAYGFMPHLSSTKFSSGFYKGSTGVGYQLLRAADPQSFPSIAAWV
jgi:type 2 lantibiotic biosynthesis protein LanM